MSRIVQVFPGWLYIKNKQLSLCLCDKFHFHMSMHIYCDTGATMYEKGLYGIIWAIQAQVRLGFMPIRVFQGDQIELFLRTSKNTAWMSESIALILWLFSLIENHTVCEIGEIIAWIQISPVSDQWGLVERDLNPHNVIKLSQCKTILLINCCPAML